MAPAAPDSGTLFGSGFQLDQYVEELTAPLLLEQPLDVRSQTKEPNATNINLASDFNPKPFLRTFEAKLEELTKLKRIVQRKIGELEDSTLAAESMHRGKLQHLSKLFDETTFTFEKLESQVADVSSAAILVGEQLEIIDRQKTKAQDAKDLVMYFQEFANNNTARLDLVKNTHGWEGKAKAASIIKRLAVIAKEVDVPQTETARKLIQNYHESMEKELLHDFDQAYKDNNTETMKKTSQILLDFNGGQSCVQAYVNQHDFFTTHSNIMRGQKDLSEAFANESVQKFEDYESAIPPLDRNVARLLDDIAALVPREWETISAVFPNAPAVLQLFLQRIFIQTVQSYMEIALRKAAAVNRLQYLRALSTISESVDQLISKLKKFFETLQIDSSSVSTLSTSLRRCQEDLFVPYNDGDKYIEKEVTTLSECYNLALQSFLLFQNNRKLHARNKGYFTKLSNAATAPITGMAVDSLIALPKEMGVSLDYVMRFLSIQKEATDRCRQLSSSSDLPRNTFNLFNIMLERVGRQYLTPALDMAIEDLLAMEPKTEPDLRYLEIVQITNEIVYKIQKFFLGSIIPKVASQPTIHRDCLIQKNNFVIALESKINLIIQKQVEAIVIWLSGILSAQRKSEYKPKETDAPNLGVATTTCNNCCEYLKKVAKSITAYVDGRNREVVLSEIGLSFHGLLITHLKRFSINTTGGLLLTRDLGRYQETISAWKVGPLLDMYDNLKQIGNLYVVKADNLKTFLEEGSLSFLDTQLLHQLVANRVDYKSARLDSLFQGAQLEKPAAPEPSQSAWENFENALDAVGGRFEELGESLKMLLPPNIIQLPQFMLHYTTNSQSPQPGGASTGGAPTTVHSSNATSPATQPTQSQPPQSQQTSPFR